jgi:AAA15 family ATPase/GTPase
MFVSFTVENFRSIKESQTLALRTERLSDVHIDNVAIPEKSNFGILKTAGIYGANASGKSNILLALKAFQEMVSSSNENKLDESLEAYDPFRLDTQSKSASITFEFEFIDSENLRYIYRVVFSRF